MKFLYARVSSSDGSQKIDRQTTEVEKYIGIMDCFAFPSIYEGLGMVAIESQTMGIKVIASEYVPVEAKISNLIEFISLSDKEKWIQEIINTINSEKKEDFMTLRTSINNNGYNINIEAKKLQNIYLESVNKRVNE